MIAETETPDPPPKLHRRSDRCLNCGLEIDSNYCPHCGQHNSNHNAGLWQFVVEFLEEFVRFDSKFFRTLLPLLTKPGFLTQEWIEGKRVRYISPLKLYFTLSALCFLALSLKSGQGNLKVVSASSEVPEAAAPLPKATKHSGIDEYINSEIPKLNAKGPAGDRNREFFRDKFIGFLPTVNFLLLPIFAFLFKLLYLRRKRYYVEHLVFALHYYSFCCLILAAAMFIPLSWISMAMFLWIVVYLYIAMLKNYRQGWFKTLVKLGFFGATYFLFVSIGLLGAVVWTAYNLPALPAAQQSAK